MKLSFSDAEHAGGGKWIRWEVSLSGMEQALYGIASMRQFVRLSLQQAIPDETTILNFRHALERQFGDRKGPYRGLPKNGARLNALFALSNLRMARRRLLAMAWKVRPGNGDDEDWQAIPA